MQLSEFAIRLFLALLAGLVIGFERQWQHKSAGLRTNALVAVGAALYVLLSIIITKEDEGDVTRIIGQVVTGIGFLCAGIIFKEGLSVHGLTTASTVWCCSAIGSLAAAGYYQETAIATLSVLAINILLRPVDDWLVNRKSKQDK